MPDIIVKNYSGNNNTIGELLQGDADKLAQDGYVPISQSWAPNQWGFWEVLIALLLCFLIIGIPFLIRMMVDPPSGTLTVIYRK